jgi:hypothetical protein
MLTQLLGSSKRKIEKLNEDLFVLQQQKKEIELEKQYLEITLKNDRIKREAELDAVEHRFQREKEDWNHDKIRMQKEIEDDKKRQILILEEDFERKQDEAISLLKLHSEQKIKQSEIDAQRKIQELEAKHLADIQELKAKLSQDNMAAQAKLMQEYYSTLNTALVELHSKGNTTTQFVQELALKMLERPMGATVTENRLLIDKEWGEAK